MIEVFPDLTTDWVRLYVADRQKDDFEYWRKLVRQFTTRKTSHPEDAECMQGRQSLAGLFQLKPKPEGYMLTMLR